MDGVSGGGRPTVDPEGLLRSALEKIVFFECKVTQLEAELEQARTVAERARGEAAAARRRETELGQALALERGAKADIEARVSELSDRVGLLKTDRERLLSGLVDRARVAGAPGSDGAPGPGDDGVDLAQFIAELRSEIETLRAFKERAERGEVASGPARTGPRERLVSSVPEVAARFVAEGRMGQTLKDAASLTDKLATHADRALYERSLSELSATDPGRRLRAVRALEALGAVASSPLLAAALGHESEADVKSAILEALARLNEPATADLAVRALEDERPKVRVAALEALAQVSRTGAEGRLSAALRDPSPIVRRRAALLLGFAHGGRVEEALAEALSDEDRGVAKAAAAALCGRPTAGAQSALVRGLDHDDVSVRRTAADALARLSGEPVLFEGSPAARRVASRRIAERLASMGNEEIRDAVLDSAPTFPSARRRELLAAGETKVPVRPAPARLAAASRPESSRVSAGANAARAAVEIAVADAPGPAALVADELAVSTLAEVRSALRGRTDEELARALATGTREIADVTGRLEQAGALVRRGPRWFTA